MTERNSYLWPRKSTLNFYRRNVLRWSSKDRKLDLFDFLMLNWQAASRTICFGVTVDNAEYKTWDEKNVAEIENNIKYDLGFDDCYVAIQRLCPVGTLQCSSEFRLKLFIKNRLV